MTLTVLIILNVLAGLLPLTGFGRTFLRARRAQKDAATAASASSDVPMIAISGPGGVTRVSTTSLGTAAKNASEQPFLAWKDVRWDLLFVVAGIMAGVTANIWSLFV